MGRIKILLENNLVELPTSDGIKASLQIIATLNSNLMYYGYVFSSECLKSLMSCDDNSLKTLWSKLEPVLKETTGDSKKMDKYVVYKNFPQEVLDMSQSKYWFNQICMYIGCPNEWFTTDEQPRDAMFEKLTLKVLHKAKRDSLNQIYEKLLKLPCRWNRSQLESVLFLFERFETKLEDIPFKENLVILASELIKQGKKVKMRSATELMYFNR